MGLFFNKPKNNNAQVWGAKAFTKADKVNYNLSVRQWSKICSAFLPDQLLAISKNCNNVISDQGIAKLIKKNELELGEKDIYKVFEKALNELVIYYAFRTLEIGYDDFTKISSITKDDFINQLSEIFELSEDNKKEIKEYITKYGSAVTSKYFNAKELTPELSAEFSALKEKEIKWLILKIYTSTGLVNFIEFPTVEEMENMKKDLQMNLIIFTGFLKNASLIS